MKTNEYKEIGASKRVKQLVGFVAKATTAKKEIVKILVASEECGDFGKGKGEMNAYAVKVTGVELRREAQGTYEACNVLRGIRSGELLAMTEDEFDSKPFGSFPLIMLSGFMGKSPEKVSEALEIIRSGLDVTKRLLVLRGVTKKSAAQIAKEKAEAEAKAALEAKEKAEREEKEKLEIVPEIQAPDSTTYVVPLAMAIMSHEELMADLIAELKGAGTVADCQTYLKNFDMLKAIVESRMEVLEFETTQQLAVA